MDQTTKEVQYHISGKEWVLEKYYSTVSVEMLQPPARTSETVACLEQQLFNHHLKHPTPSPFIMCFPPPFFVLKIFFSCPS